MAFNNRKKNIVPTTAKIHVATTADELNPKLSRIAKEETVIAGCVDGLGSEQAGRQRAPGSADAMNSDHI